MKKECLGQYIYEDIDCMCCKCQSKCISIKNKNKVEIESSSCSKCEDCWNMNFCMGFPKLCIGNYFKCNTDMCNCSNQCSEISFNEKYKGGELQIIKSVTNKCYGMVPYNLKKGEKYKYIVQGGFIYTINDVGYLFKLFSIEQNVYKKYIKFLK